MDGNGGLQIGRVGRGDVLFGALIFPSSILAGSPDSKRLAYTRDPVIVIWDAASRKISKQLENQSIRFSAVAFSPNGRLLAAAAADKSINVWDITTGYLVIRLQVVQTRANLRSVVWSSDGKQVQYALDDGTTGVLDVPAESGALPPPANLNLEVK